MAFYEFTQFKVRGSSLHKNMGPSRTEKAKRPEPTSRRRAKRKTVENVVCPRCLAEAIYRYGKSANGKKRYLCQVCGRQFVIGPPARLDVNERPACPACGKPMHVYMRNRELIRFRCADYPHCRTFLKRPAAATRPGDAFSAAAGQDGFL
jgi:transposase-like protein